MLRFDHSDQIPRDRWNRPVIDGIAYTRATTLASTLDSKEALIKWGARMTAIGLSSSPDLIAETSTTDPADKQALDGIVSRAQDRAGARSGASIGTATHKTTELVDAGDTTRGLPEAMVADALAYRRWCEERHLVPLAAECFVVNRALGAAGTFDRLTQGPNKAVILDIKTSANPDAARWNGLSWAIQLAVYAGGQPWSPTHGFMSWADLGLPQPDLARGLVVHIVQGKAEVTGYSIDLRVGLTAAHLAREVYEMRKAKGLAIAL